MRHIAVISKKPELSGKNNIPDGAITGNGDLSVILGNSESGMRIHLAKCDLWFCDELHSKGGIRPFGNIDIDIPAELYENYYVEQDADEACIRCRFENGNKKIGIRITVLKTENTVLIESDGTEEILPVLKCVEGDRDGEIGKSEFDSVEYIYRKLGDKEKYFRTEAFGAIKKISAEKFIFCCASNHDVEKPLESTVEHIKSIVNVDGLKMLHSEEWKKFWSKSSVRLSDETLENGWYQSIYLLAVCTGNKKFPPGLFGNFITVEHPAWKGDYHLNYNYQAPFYSACSSNHVELTDCYHAPLEEFIETGKKYASVFGCRGILYPVGIQPGGFISEYQPQAVNPFMRLFLGQKSNAIHPADIMAFRWKSTRDAEYAEKHAYPYMKLCLEFFEDFGYYEKGVFNVEKDSVHEVPMYKDDYSDLKYKRVINDKNNVLTLGLLRLILDAAIDMSDFLGVDEEKRKIWKKMLKNLAPFPTCIRKFRRVFRYTEKGQRWHPDNTLGIQHIYPCGCVNLNSDKKLIKIAMNSINSTYRWEDDNGTNSIFPAAVRVGYPAKFIIEKLKLNIEKFQLPNMLFRRYGGCLENCSLIPNVINEMALQSAGGVVRFFPVWDKSIDCEYNNLRADGAFLVSASIKNGKIGNILVYSEKGGELTYIDPFSGKKMTVLTEAGETVEITQ